MMMRDGLFGYRGHARIAKTTSTMAPVQIVLQLHPLFPGGFFAGISRQQMFPFAPARGGQGIPQTKSDKLHQPRPVAVRKITAFMPALVSGRQGSLTPNPAPMLFPGHQPAQMFTFGSGRSFHRTVLYAGTI